MKKILFLLLAFASIASQALATPPKYYVYTDGTNFK